MAPDDLAPAMLAAGLPLLAAALLGTDRPLARALILLPAIGWTAAWMAWRWTTPLTEGGLAQAAWGAAFLVAETLFLTSLLPLALVLLRQRDRSDASARPVPHALRDAPVDVFILAGDETLETLERSILCATAIAHRDLRVWVLEAGAREELAALALSLGALHLPGEPGRGDAAALVNAALAHALARGRRPGFVLLLDGDIAAHRALLRRSLPLMAEETTGVVQISPRVFSPDPVQAGLLAAQGWPDAQRFVLDTLMPAQDAWGVALCRGRATLWRAEALLDAGGMVEDTPVPELATGLALRGRGWQTAMLARPLAIGRAPDTLDAFVEERRRWSDSLRRALVQPRVPGAQRLAVAAWLLQRFAGGVARIAMLAAPALFWLFGLQALPTGAEVALLPAAVALVLGFGLVSGWRLAPILTGTTRLLALLPGLVRPAWPWPLGAQQAALAACAAFALPTAAGLAAHGAAGTAGDAYPLHMAWSLLNLLLLACVATCCTQPPRPRAEERFATDEPVRVVGHDGTTQPARLTEIATRGARIEARGPVPAHGMLLLDGLSLRFGTVRRLRDGAALRLTPDPAQRREMILRLYTGGYLNQPREPALLPAFRGGLRRLFG
jgi:cellulose synthase (UDP-forming)